MPTTASRKLPRHPVPVVLLARLAVDRSVQACGLGKFLLFDALNRCLEISERLGVHAIEVDALDEAARHFYLRFGFIPLQDSAFHLYLPMSSIADAFGERKEK
jgi:GNAT superfamily N-acetyltransferase